METSNAPTAEEFQDAPEPVPAPASRKIIGYSVILFTLVSVFTEIAVDTWEWGLEIPRRVWYVSLLETLMTITTVIIALAARRSIVGFLIAAAICGYFSYNYIYPLFQ